MGFKSHFERALPSLVELLAEKAEQPCFNLQILQRIRGFAGVSNQANHFLSQRFGVCWIEVLFARPQCRLYGLSSVEWLEDKVVLRDQKSTCPRRASNSCEDGFDAG